MKTFCTLLLTIAMLVSIPIADAQADLLFGQLPGAAVTSQLSLPDTVLRQQPVSVDFDLLTRAALGETNHLRFNLFDGLMLEGLVTGTTVGSAGSFTLIGEIAGDVPGTFAIAVHQGVARGTVRTLDGRHFQVMYTATGIHEIRQLDDTMFPPCSVDDRCCVHDHQASSGFATHGTAADDGSVFDVMVVYTPNARSAVGGTAAMQALINLAVAETNTAYSSSLVNTTINLVHTAEVTYNESGGFYDSLYDLQGTSDGQMDNIHTLRDTYAADMVSLIIDDSGSCGIGFLMTTLSSGFEDSAFSVVHHGCATGYYSFGHELGHNLGCHHALPETSQGSGLYNYSMGWRFASDTYRTIMAYAPGTRIPRFSNPNVNYAGYATGQPLGNSDEAHNALSISNAAYTAANWRQSASTWTGPTISAALACLPASGTLPFQTQMSVALTNLYPDQLRRIAGHLDVQLAGGAVYTNWRVGFTNVAAGGSYSQIWLTTIPSLASVTGNNTFSLVAEDVTPTPYNQPPYPVAGDTDSDNCVVTGIAP